MERIPHITMRRYLEQFFYTIPDEAVREQQAEQFALERESLERHRAEAKRMVAHLLRRDARILVMDVSHGGFKPEDVEFERLVELAQEEQFGSGPIAHGEAFRTMLGFDVHD